MMKTPFALAAAIARFIAGASSPTRRVAPWHQCWFHMSQMMMAVCSGCHLRTFSVTTTEPPDPLFPARASGRARQVGLEPSQQSALWPWAAHAKARQPIQAANFPLLRQNEPINGTLPSRSIRLEPQISVV